MNRASRRRGEDDPEETPPPAASVPAGSLPSSGPDSPKRERTSPPQFLREVRTELRKVAWPSRHEVVNYTVVVLVVTTLLTLIVGLMDWVLRNATINLFG